MLENETVSLDFFKFVFKFPSGGTLKGLVKGQLQPDNNTVANLSNLLAVYYAPFIPPNYQNSLDKSLSPIVFNSLNLEFDSLPQFTLNGEELISFSGTNNNGDVFKIKNDPNESLAIVNSATFTLGEIDISSLNNIDEKNYNFSFKAEKVIYRLHVNVQLEKDTSNISGIGFPDQANLEGFFLFPNNIAELKTFNYNCSSQNGFDYPFQDFLLIFSNEKYEPNFALVSNEQECKLTAINPGRVRVGGTINPSNPDTFEFIGHWNVGYSNPDDLNEIFTKGGSNHQFLEIFEEQKSQFVLLDENGQREAIYNINQGALNVCN